YDSAGRPTSRLLYLWDTTSSEYDAKRSGSKAPISFPNGSSVGTLYTRAQLTAELRSKAARIPATDLNGHGTACAGVAAGNGNNGKDRAEVVGVAPQADLIAVRVGGTSAGYIENSYLLNAALGWLDSLPELRSRPLVVSYSVGGQVYGHDGNTVEEHQLSARFSPDRKGRAITIAAGNEGTERIHSEVGFAGTDNKGHVTWGAPGGGLLQVYFDNSTCDGIKIIPDPKLDTELRVFGLSVNPLSKKCEAAVAVSSQRRGGLYLYTLSGRRVIADLYSTVRYPVEFSDESVSYSKLVGMPGTASNAITVGSYDWNDIFKDFSVRDFCRGDSFMIGGLSCYSSIGYSRNGEVKPEIVAPGEIYHASYAKLPDGSGVIPMECSSRETGCTPQIFRERFVDASGNYQLFNGTSAATPYTAGIIALVFERRPQLTFGEVRRLLTQSATADNFTSQVPNIKWG
ncbi:MAG: S8 family serine peptidase, partial [Acidobacteriota bacterium]|nr:S8 family serine peptidase [Acidobacteriota bacterium]